MASGRGKGQGRGGSKRVTRNTGNVSGEAGDTEVPPVANGAENIEENSSGDDRNQSQHQVAGGSNSGGGGRSGVNPNVTSDLEMRKRKLDLEIEATRLKLRLVEAERQRLELGEYTPNESDNSINEPIPVTSSTDNNRTLVETMSRAFADALRVDRGARSRENPPTLLNRLASDKQTLSFSGNSLEWLRFKRAFLQSSELGGYSDQENASRLYNCLKGEARTVVESLMITTESAKEIMEALEQHYGNADEIVRKLLNAIRELPKLGHRGTNIITFASVIKNNVAALISIGHKAYLRNLEIIQDVIKKIPTAMVYRYNEFVSQQSDPPDLATLAEFLTKQADMANKAGTARIHDVDYRDRGDRWEKRERPVNKRTFAISSRTRSRSPRKDNTCGFCSSLDHVVCACPRFSDLDLDRKWQWVRRENRCYKCLSRDHLRPECTMPDCTVEGCGRPHNALLHAGKAPRKTAPTRLSTQTTPGNKTVNST